jgi:hypothetical protein
MYALEDAMASVVMENGKCLVMAAEDRMDCRRLQVMVLWVQR